MFRTVGGYTLHDTRTEHDSQPIIEFSLHKTIHKSFSNNSKKQDKHNQTKVNQDNTIQKCDITIYYFKIQHEYQELGK